MRKKLAWLLILMLFCASLFGCASRSYDSNSSTGSGVAQDGGEAVAPQEAPEISEELAGGDKLSETQTSPNFGGHKIIRRFEYTIETDAFEQQLTALKDRTSAVGGYVESGSVSGKKPEAYNDPGRYAYLTLRIPEEAVDAFVAGIEQIETVTYSNSTTEDVSESYFDLETRLSVLRTQLDNLKALLAKAQKLEDMLALETEISRITIQIEELTTQLRSYDQLISYATVYVSLQEKALTEGPASNKSVGERIGEGITSVINGIGVFFENLFVVLVVISPVLLILAAIVIPVLLIIRRRNRKRRAALAEKTGNVEQIGERKE